MFHYESETAMAKNKTPAQWLALFNAQERSGLTAQKFCFEQGLNPAYFSTKKKALKNRKKNALTPQTNKQTSFVRIDPVNKQPVPPEHTSMILHMGPAHLVFNQHVPAEYIARLVQYLS